MSDVEARNIEIFPSNYDRALNNATPSNAEDLEKIDLNDFMNEPTE